MMTMLLQWCLCVHDDVSSVTLVLHCRKKKERERERREFNRDPNNRIDRIDIINLVVIVTMGVVIVRPSTADDKNANLRSVCFTTNNTEKRCFIIINEMNPRCANLRFRDIEQHCVWSNVNWRALFNRLNVIELNFIVCFQRQKKNTIEEGAAWSQNTLFAPKLNTSTNPTLRIMNELSIIETDTTIQTITTTNDVTRDRWATQCRSTAIDDDTNSDHRPYCSRSLCNVWSSITPFVCDERLS